MTEDDGNLFVVMWDREGLDNIIDATEMNRDDVFNSLRGTGGQGLARRMDYMVMRARFNCHRVCEIYSIRVDSEITADDIAGWFEVNPQGAADLIRARGKRLLSQKHGEARQVIS